ncbi:MAG: sulfite exporter TauE/SafE family protein [Methylococcales bacterium]|nr:sulfite exporter TauE/SafE family protein [Methylococcales bacterium]
MLELFLLTMLLGVVAGILAGLFGLGGGVIIVPALLWLFSAQKFPDEYIMIMAIATSLATIIFTSLASIIAHHKHENIKWDRVYRLIPGVFIGAAVGAVLADWVDAEILKDFFIVYLFYVGIRMALQLKPGAKKVKIKSYLDYPVGHGIGLLSAILGIGGGTLTVPYLLGQQVAMKNAVAISSVCGMPIALSGVLVYILLSWDKVLLPEWSFGYIYLPALLGVVLCSVITAPIGAKLANKLPAQKIKRYFSGIIIFIAIKMMLG